MPFLTPQPVTIIPARTSGGSLKNAANLISYSGAAQGEAKDLWAAVTKALRDAQSQLDGIANALRAPLAIPDPIQIVDASGNLIAVLGQILDPSTNTSYTGIWEGSGYFGGTGPGNATTTILGGTITTQNLKFNPQSPRSLAYQNVATTSLTNTIFVPLSFDTNAFDFGSIHSTSVNPTRFTITTPGCYLATAQVQAPAAAGILAIRIEKNGSTTTPTFQSTAPNNASGTTVVCTGLLQLVANDFIEFFAMQNSGGAVSSVNTVTWGSVCLISQP